jgi:hypothetical protein
MIDRDIAPICQVDFERPKWICLPNLLKLFNGHESILPRRRVLGERHGLLG